MRILVSALIVLFCAGSAQAATVLADNPTFVQIVALDRGLGLPADFNLIGSPAFPSGPFAHSAHQGRVDSIGTNQWTEGPDGLLLQVSGDLSISAGAGTALDQSSDTGFVSFSVTVPTPYSVTGTLLGTGTNDLFLATVRLTNDVTSAPVYWEARNSSPVDTYSYSLGTNPTHGTNTGILAPGDYSFWYEHTVLDLDGDGSQVLGSSSLQLQIGVVPEPSSLLLALVGCGCLAARRKQDF